MSGRHNPVERVQKPSLGLRSSLEIWVLWVLASAAGGAVAGAIAGLASEPLGSDGYLFLPGLALGTAQALVLRRYLSNRAVGPWVVASFVGWFAGVLLVFVLAFLLAGLLGAGAAVPEITQRVGPVMEALGGGQTEYSNGQPFYLTIWASFAISQGIALALVLLAFGGRTGRSSLSLAALWVLAGIAGGVLGVAADLYVNVAVFPGEERGLLGRVAPPATALAVAGALYGAVTGVVLAMITRRSVG